jgi:hypothetical protein
MVLTQEQELVRLLVVALHRLGGSMDVDQKLLDNLGYQQIVWNHREDMAYTTISVKSGEVLIASVDNDVVEVVL